jgi:tripartite-type tricarboxylate transporter receptor subunit TctC
MTIRYAAVFALTLAAAAGSSAANAQSDFYKGKTLEVLVGFSAGGGYDLYGRTLAQFIGKHIPGEPTVVVRNMPGAGSLALVNNLFSVAPKNGLTIGIFDPTLITAPLLGMANANFDASKLSWIGSLSTSVNMCIVWHESPIKNWQDLMDAKEPVPFGTTGPNDSRYQHTAILRNMFGAKIKVIAGYTGSSPVRLAMERGEIAGNCGDSWSSLKSTASDWIKERKVNLIAQFAIAKHPDLPDVPLIIDQAKNPRDKAALKLLLGTQAVGRPFAGPPDIPPERLAILRRAFDAAAKDPQLLAMAEKAQLEIDPISGERADEIIGDIYRTPPDAVEAAKNAIK